jgi:UrcA family protein
MKIANLAAGLALGAMPALIALAPAAAQDSAEEIIVTGSLGEVPDSVRTLSQSVSYADLDLSTEAGRDILRHRVSLTARFLCDKLGEGDTSSPIVPSCRDAAVSDAMSRVETLQSSFAPRGTTWVRPPAWHAPYPVEWVTRYPLPPAD